jgi:hypothetical protein
MNGLRMGLAIAAMVGFTSLASSAHAQATPSTTEPSTSTPAPAPDPSAAPASSATPTTEPPAETSRRTAWPWILMGTGVALVVTAAVFQFRAVSEDDKREDAETKIFSLPQGDPQRKSLQVAIQEHDDSAKSSRTASLVIGTVGFLAIAGSVVWWFVEGGSSAPTKSASPPKSKPSFVPALTPGYAGATLVTSF